jgi:hypothetical protein
VTKTVSLRRSKIDFIYPVTMLLFVAIFFDETSSSPIGKLFVVFLLLMLVLLVVRPIASISGEYLKVQRNLLTKPVSILVRDIIRIESYGSGEVPKRFVVFWQSHKQEFNFVQSNTLFRDFIERNLNINIVHTIDEKNRLLVLPDKVLIIGSSIALLLLVIFLVATGGLGK